MKLVLRTVLKSECDEEYSNNDTSELLFRNRCLLALVNSESHEGIQKFILLSKERTLKYTEDSEGKLNICCTKRLKDIHLRIVVIYSVEKTHSKYCTN